MKGSDVLLIIVAIVFPPVAVASIAGCHCDLMINILLTFLGYIPGLLHALWIINGKFKADEKYGSDNYKYLGNGKYGPKSPVPAPPPPHDPAAQTSQTTSSPPAVTT